jgi:hypothetical protein
MSLRLTSRMRRSKARDDVPPTEPTGATLGVAEPAEPRTDDAPEATPTRAVAGAEGRLLLGDVPVRARVQRVTPAHVDLAVIGRPAAFDWQRDSRAAFDYVDEWGVCRLMGTASLIGPCAGMGEGEQLVRLETPGELQRVLRRRHMRADLSLPVVLTVEGSTMEIACTTVNVSAGGAMLDVALDVPVGQRVSFLLQTTRPFTGDARVVRFANGGMAIEFAALVDDDRRHLELAILEAPRTDEERAVHA